MRRVVVASAALVAAAWLGTAALEACGVKFLVTQRSGRLAGSTRTAPALNILVYQHDAAVAGISRRLEATFEKVGHTVTIASDLAAFRNELDADGFTLVLMHFEAAEQLRRDVESRSPGVRILPWLEHGTRADVSRAEDDFGHVLEVGSRRQEILATIEASARDN